jgi:hypothetical protein
MSPFQKFKYLKGYLFLHKCFECPRFSPLFAEVEKGGWLFGLLLN